MTQVYTTRHNGHLYAFWQDGDGVAFYTPGNLLSPERWSVSSNDMATHNIHYDESISDQFDDIVNRVWRYQSATDFRSPLDRAAVQVSRMIPGRYRPRIWRGFYDPSNPLDANDLFDPRDVYGYAYTQSIVAAASLLDQLEELFRSIEPERGNLQSYGHRSRELFILTCTEIEAGWRAILNGNLINKKSRYTTNDYVKLKGPLRLSEWIVRLENYPNLGTFSPYKDWQKGSPTQSIKWYDAYNACKHDREGCFACANLENLLGAMAALHILLAAQWGPANFGGSWPPKGPFFVVDLPSYGPDEVYLPSLDSSPPIPAAPFL
jgi:hypothetical protein